MNKNNLNRIKGILSAKQGTLVPKFLKGNILYHKTTGFPIYSPDGQTWYEDPNYKVLFEGNLINYTKSGISNDTLSDNYLIPRLQILEHLDEFIAKHTPVKTILSRSLNTIPTTVPITRDIESAHKAAMKSSASMQLSEEDQKLLDLMMYKKANIAQGISTGIQSIGNIFGASLQVTDSQLTKNITTGYDTVANVAENFGPMGQIIGGAMKTLGAIGNISQTMGGGTDQQTKLDSWMDSPLLSWNAGVINGFFGKNTDSFGVDLETLLQVGGSYGGITTSINEAAESADKEYGLFSGKARKKANDAINKAKQLQNSMGNIANQASDQRLAVQSMGEQSGLAYSMMTSGGYDLKYTYAAKEGGILEQNSFIASKWEPKIEINWELPVFKEGGDIEFVDKLEWIPELQKGGKTQEYPQEYLKFKESLPDNHKYTPENEYRMYKYWQLWGKPENFEYTLNNPNEDGDYMFNWDTSDSSYHGSTIAWGDDGVGYFIKPKHHDTILYELDYYNDGTITKEGGKLRKPNKKERESWEEFRRNYILEDDGDFYKYVPVKQILQDLEISQLKYLKEGGSLGDKDIPEIEETNLKNVIPEGALHKNKHHMEHAEGLTKKGIPVIDEEGELQAEIEHSEIIFTLEVTKKLEEYYQIFYSEESSNKEKEQAALDAGKLLVYQILENTEDRTGLIDSCKKGGTLTHKISNDSIKEISEWIPNIVIIEKEFEKNPKNKEKSEKDNIKDIIKEVLIEILTNK